MSVRTVALVYRLGMLPVLLASFYLAGLFGAWALLVPATYAVGLVFIRCPRCGLGTSQRVRLKRGREVLSRAYYPTPPRRCGRCDLDLARHRLGEKFPEPDAA